MSNRRDFFKQALVLPLVGRLFQQEEIEEVEPTQEVVEPVVHWQASQSLSPSGEYMVELGGQLMELRNATFYTGDGVWFARQSVDIEAVFYGDYSAIEGAFVSNRSVPWKISTFIEGDVEYRGECKITSIELSVPEQRVVVCAHSSTDLSLLV